MNDLLPPDTTLLDQPTNQLLDAFGAGRASPGSGSAAALMGLLAVKLIRTVCLKSLEKNLGRETDVTLQHILKELDASEPALRALFEKDAHEFEEIVRLIVERNQAVTQEAKGPLTREINRKLEIATDNVFQIIDVCLPLIDRGVTVFEHGWGTVRGDSGAAISAAIAAVTSGLFIANLNIKWLKARKYGADNIGRATALRDLLEQKQQTALGCMASLNAEALDSLTVEGTASLQLPLPLIAVDVDAPGPVGEEGRDRVAQISHTHPEGHEALAIAVLDGLAAARQARPIEHARAPAAPKPNCHDAVDVWITSHVGSQAVRGWLVDARDDGSVHLIAHSVVRNPDGTLLDPSFTPGEPVYPFVPHPRTTSGFFSQLCRPGAPYDLVVFTRDGEASS
ncbi:cyclodeaminase/cyclohydrolase family protein [Burkholderia ambifaria]